MIMQMALALVLALGALFLSRSSRPAALQSLRARVNRSKIDPAGQ